MAVVLYSETDGVYLGSCLGLGFWSKCDTAGQSTAVTFPSEAAANEYMAEWDGGRPAGIKCVEVVADELGYASIGACVAAGLPAWMDEQTPVANALPV